MSLPYLVLVAQCTTCFWFHNLSSSSKCSYVLTAWLVIHWYRVIPNPISGIVPPVYCLGSIIDRFGKVYGFCFCLMQRPTLLPVFWIWVYYSLVSNCHCDCNFFTVYSLDFIKLFILVKRVKQYNIELRFYVLVIICQRQTTEFPI